MPLFSKKTIRKLKTVFLAFVFLGIGIAYSKPLNPIQIIFSGNFSGQTVYWNESLRPLPADCWKAPSLIGDLKKHDEPTTFIAGMGNDADIFSAFSFINSGEIDWQLSKLCKPDFQALGPKDLGIFRNKLLSQNIRLRNWTNLRPIKGHNLFPISQKIVKNGLTINCLSFISKDFLSAFPIQLWGNLEVENPCETLRRIGLRTKENSINLILAHLNDKDLHDLKLELFKLKGYFFIGQINQKVDETTPDHNIQTESNTYLFKLPDGCHFLPVLNIYRRNYGYPRATLRILPLKKAETGDALKLFEKEYDHLFHQLNNVLTMIPTNIAATTSPNRFSPKTHANFVADYSRSDLSIVPHPNDEFRGSNLIKPGNFFGTFENYFILKFRLSGFELKKLVKNLVVNSGVPGLEFGRCNFNYFAGDISEILVSGQPIGANSYYTIAVSSKILEDHIFKDFFKNLNQTRNEGIMLWDVWASKLPKLKISSEMLDN